MNDPLSRDVSRRRGEQVPTLSLAVSRYAGPLRTVTAIAKELTGRVSDLEKSLSKLSNIASESDDTEMQSQVTKGNAAVAAMRKAASTLGNFVDTERD